MKNVLTTAIIASTLAFAGAAYAKPFTSDIFTQSQDDTVQSTNIAASSFSGRDAEETVIVSPAHNTITNGSLPR